MYAAHLEKGCMLLGMGSDWKTKAVSVAGHGLAEASDKTGSPRAAVTRGQLIELTQRRGWDGQFAVLIFLIWTFPLRIPSEAPPLRRQRVGQDLESDERLEERAVIGLVSQKLAIKLNRRKHMAAGSRMVRVCVWSECADATDPLRTRLSGAPRPTAVLPSVPRVAGRTQDCSNRPFYLPHIDGEVGARRAALGSSLRRMGPGIEAGHPQCPQRGGPSYPGGAPTVSAGGSLSQLLRAGQRHSSAYKLYLEMGREETTAVSSLLADASNDKV